MPLALEPNRTFRVVLESDQKKRPKAKQPYFVFRYLSGREWKELTKKADAIELAKDGIAALDKVFEILSFGMVGWENMIEPKTKKTIAFKISELDRLLTMNEANELLVKFRNQGLELADLKNLG